MNGFLVLDKPAGLTSHDCVGLVRAALRIKKVGHTGTLDPFATGVLPLAIGHATRFIQFLDEGEKVYEATLALGTQTDTGDLEGEAIQTADVPDLALGDVQAALASLVGEQMQAPPAYSAVKVDGKRMYEYARAGIEKQAAARPITVHELEVLSVGPEVRFRVRSSKGTYVRVLGEDIARLLGTVGHLNQLRRLRSGPFEGGVPLSDFAQALTGQSDWQRAFRGRRDERLTWGPREPAQELARAHLVTLPQAFGALPSHACTEDEARRLANGHAPPAPVEAGVFTALADGELQAICEATAGRSRILRGLPTN
ncbi:MAG: tRNA pseudouridine(55) synthase TruB [Proteobacteria bacterium]|nr:tRNA pseudouridine(55) synthase TruB [Pseudomonadota bacterium]